MGYDLSKIIPKVKNSKSTKHFLKNTQHFFKWLENYLIVVGVVVHVFVLCIVYEMYNY